MTGPAEPRRPRLGGLRGLVGTEQEMSFNRLIFAGVFAAYLPTLGAPVLAVALPMLGCWSVCALGIFLHIRHSPQPNTPRRAIALLADTGFLSGFLHVGGAWAAPFFPVYLWVALGNGFRFGTRWLLAGMAAFVLGFGTVALTTPYWRALPELATGLLLGPVILALYAAVLIRKLSQARLAAEQASAAKTRFLAGVSHELRTPLNAIIGMGGLLRTTPLDLEQTDMARTIDIAARGLLQQINGLLDISRIEAGATVMRSESVDLAALLAETRGLLLAQAREKGLLLRLHATPRTPPRILADAAALRDILLNLGGNAVKFTAAGSVTIAVDAEPGEDDVLWLRLEVSDTGIGIDAAAQSRIFERFAQADDSIAGRFGGTGLGLALCKGLVELAGGTLGLRSRPGEGSCFHVLLPLRRDPSPATPAVPPQALLLAADLADAAPVAAGLAALGVAVVQRLVPASIHAALWGATETPPTMLLACAGPGGLPATEEVAAALRGAGPAAELPVFAIVAGHGPGLPDEALRRRVAALLPATPAPPDWAMPLALAAALLPRAVAPAAAARPVSRMRILVADDNKVNRLVVQKILEREGHAVALAEDGEAALDALEAESFDLVLMDLNMPRTDGIAATKLYRFNALGRRHLPILGLTADATAEAAERCRAAGMDGCLVKPIEPAQLAAAVAAHAPQPADDPPARVTPIDVHPRFRPVLPPSAPPALDPAVTADLVALGGRRFAAELVQDFLDDAAEVMRSLEAAAAQADVARFRAAAHALRSGAANLGARGIFALSSAAEALPAAEVAVAGQRHVALLAAELDRVRAAGQDSANGTA